MHYFIQNIATHKNMSQILQEIAERPACTKIIDALHASTLTDNSPLQSQRNLLLAELYFYSKNEQAHSYYSKIPKKELSTTTKANTFNAYIAAMDTFGKKEIDYLSSLFKNVSEQLKTIDTTNPKLSYRIGLLTHYLINNNAQLNATDKIDIILNGLDHLEYAQKNGIPESVDTTINENFHTLLSSLYEAQNNTAASLKHMICALTYQSRNGKSTVNNEFLATLTRAEEQNPQLFRNHACVIKFIVHFILRKPYAAKQKMYDLLNAFASSDLCSQLVSYCEQACSTTAEQSNEIISLMALAHQHNGDHDKACDLMNKLSQPTPTPALWLKTAIYAAAQKSLSDADLETIFRLYSNNKKPSAPEQETILSLITTSPDFFIRTKNYSLALKLITKFSELHTMPPATIQFAYHITQYLTETSDPYLKQCHNELNASQFYKKIQEPSVYDPEINNMICIFLIKKRQGKISGRQIEKNLEKQKRY